MLKLLPTYDDVVSAAARISGIAVRTPLLNFPVLDALCNACVYLKPECLQRTGSFKIRGACNAIFSRLDEARAKGVFACSTGNHAQGIAEVCRLLDVHATIIMPDDAPTVKINKTRNYGAEIILYSRRTENRDAIFRERSAESGAVAIHPFEDPHIIAGQGTLGLEIADDMVTKNIQPDRLMVPTGGGA